ncbi:MAG TPA: hypothetical protein VK485_11515 [Sphingomicrobium sp.]|nr:hypothetical protein [Sphingomicrobium sp.]
MRVRLVAATVALLTFGAASASAAVIVVKSSGPSARNFPAGKALQDGDKLSLKSNDLVVLLDSRGTRTLRGPGSFPAASTGPARSMSSLAALTGQGRARGRVGAVRGPVPRSIWQADSQKSETMCFANTGDISIYRDNIAAAETVTVKDLASGRSAKVNFAATMQTAPWPAEVPIAANGRYQIGGSTVSMKSISPLPAGLEGIAQSLIRNDCQGQLDILINTFTIASSE